MPDLPWWAAIAIAGAATLLGIAFDAMLGQQDLTGIFTTLYVLGCFGAVVAVRRAGVFTAVIQPPLILFFAVPGAYWLFRGVRLTDVKGILINCGYPLIERFPLMFFTTAGVLLIGLARWYFGAVPGDAAAPGDTSSSATWRWAAATIGKLATRLNVVLGQHVAHATGSGSRVRAGVGRTSRTGRTTSRSGRTTGSARTRSRRARPTAGDASELRTEPTRRRRPAPARGDAPQRTQPRRRPAPGRGDTAPTRGRPARRSASQVPDTGGENRPRRRPRAPQESARDVRERRPQPDRHSSRGDRMDGSLAADPGDAPRRPRRDTPTGYGADPGHHPVSRARYRRAESGDDEPPPIRTRRFRAEDAESWQYDI